MKSILGVIYCIGVFCVWGGSVVLAQEGSTNDCSLIAAHSSSDKYADVVYQTFAESGVELQVMTKKDLTTAHLHLKQYCCEQSTSLQNCEGLPKTANYYPQSPYIFDQLLNVAMRKMDGIEDHCLDLGIDCEWVDGSREHIDWRKEVLAIAEDRDGHPSYELEGQFRSYRGQPGEYDQPEKILNRYTTMCEELVHIRQRLPDFNANETDLLLTNKRGLLGICTDVINQRYLREYNYVRALMVEKAILYQADNLRSYLSDYFNNTRLQGLMGKYATIDGCFNMVLKYVRRTDCCNL